MPLNRLTRRQLVRASLVTPSIACASTSLVEVPVLRMVDKNAGLTPAELQRFNATVWDEAVRLFRSAEVALRVVGKEGEIRRYPSSRPRFMELERHMINVVLTGVVPLAWDNGRSLCGVSAVYEGYHVIVVAVKRAHGNRVPFVDVNTVVHELLHVLRGDIHSRREGFLNGADTEAAVDWQATWLWLAGRASGVRASAEAYVQALRRAW